MTCTDRLRSAMRAPALGLLTVASLGLALLAAPPPAGAASQRKLVDIVIAPSQAGLIPGATQAYTATGIWSDGAQEDVTAQVAWKVRDTKVATIDATGLLTAGRSGRTEIGASLPGTQVSARKTAKISVAGLDEITVEPVSSNLRVGSAMALKALGTYDDGTSGVDITSQVIWGSKKKSVVRIETDAEGATVAVGVAKGETNVEARHLASGVRSKSTSGKIKVVGTLVAIDVDPNARIVRHGERVRFRATGIFERGSETDVSFEVDWSTGDPSIATVDAEGRVTGHDIGSTTVVATDPSTQIASTDDGNDGRIDVVGDMIKLEVKPRPLSMTLGATSQMKAHATFEDIAKAVNMTTKVEWRSTDPSKVEVSRLGVVSCLAAGSALISVRDPFSRLSSSDSGSDALVRCGIPVTGVVVTPGTHTMRVGKNKKAKAWLVYADGSRDDVTKRVVWGSSNLAVATVDVAEPNIGRVNALASGTATITADDPLSGFGSEAPGGKSLLLTVP